MIHNHSPEMQSERPKTIVFVESAAAMGGVQFSTLYLAQSLDKGRWRPIVVCPQEGDLTNACRESGIETHVLDHLRLWSTSIRVGATRLPNPAAWAWDAGVIVIAARRLKRFLVQCSPDLVVTKGLSSHFLGGLAARKLRIPCVWHVQDFISERTFGIYRRVFGRAARWLPTQVIADGVSIAEQLPRSLQSRITTIHNGVDTSVFHPGLDGAGVRREFAIPVGDLVVGHMGRITPWKGQHYLIEAFARIANRNPNVTLLLVGAPVFDNDSYQRRLLNLATQFGLDGRIKFAGFRHDTARVLAAMDLFAFTSIEKDTSPLALLSAMACGLPIVAFDIAGVRELMASEDQFLLAPVADIAALGRALSEVLSDQSLRQRLAASGRKQAMNEFNLEKYAGRIEQVFRVALQSVRSSDAGRILPEVHHSAAL
ncbi:MAG TPA: glycosyltransferase family 4 protein [Pyrinomonadaceae bacterium]|nr:glycosyltransferase family 4 protein [Pyrinomonadaceae bacterium]